MRPSPTSPPDLRVRCFAVCAPGAERWTAAEVHALGAEVVDTEPGGVTFRATTAHMYAATLWLRTATRVMVRLAEFPARTFGELETRAAAIRWSAVVAPSASVRFKVTARLSSLYHEGAIAERLGAACVTAVPGARIVEGGADDGDTRDDAQLFIVRVLHDSFTLSADCAGALLHRRGYRLAGGKAPLRETLAATLLLAAGYDGSAPLVDPLCGSGTIAIEAAMIARRMAPGLKRSFAFERWPSFEAETWQAVRTNAEARVLPAAPHAIVGSDRDRGVIASAIANAERAGVATDVTFACAAISDAPIPLAPHGYLVTNPPYGVRIGDRTALGHLFAQLGRVARVQCPGWSVTLLSAHTSYEWQMRLPLVEEALISNGGLRLRLVHAGPAPAAQSRSSRSNSAKSVSPKADRRTAGLSGRGRF